MGASTRKIVVRTGKDYPYRFGMLLGQENVEFVTGPVTPHLSVRLPRMLRFHRLQGLALIEPGYDLLHLKNAIPLFHTRPYVLTFEDYLPRVPDDFYVGALHGIFLRALASPRCRRIFAESEYAVRQFLAQNEGRRERDAIAAKVEVLRPAIAPRAATPKMLGDSLHLLFVGRDFLRKGGPALTRAHERLRRAGMRVETTVVSDFRHSKSDYVAPPDDALNERERRRAADTGLRLLGRQPPEEVARLMRAADVLVMPTFHDTFGYVALEALASGTLVIATATCAMPEIVRDGVNGWLLPFENDDRIGRWIHLYRTAEPGDADAYASTVERLADDIVDRVIRLAAGEVDYAAMSASALTTISDRFSVEVARQRLETAYRAAIVSDADETRTPQLDPTAARSPAPQ
jgi:glycosyltransferase involved in cell wall biosynthesis